MSGVDLSGQDRINNKNATASIDQIEQVQSGHGGIYNFSRWILREVLFHLTGYGRAKPIVG
jgi:hypothetical protein